MSSDFQQDPAGTSPSSEYGRFDDENDAPVGGDEAGVATSTSPSHTAARGGASLMDRLQIDTGPSGQTQNTAATDYSRFGDAHETSGNDNDNTNNDDASQMSPAEKLKGVVRQRIQFRKRRKHYEESFERNNQNRHIQAGGSGRQEDDVKYETVSYELTDTAWWNTRKTALQERSVYDLSIPCCPGQTFEPAACCTADLVVGGDSDEDISINGTVLTLTGADADANEQRKRRNFGRSNLRNMKFLSRLSLVGIGVAVATIGFLINLMADVLLELKLRFALGNEEEEAYVVGKSMFWRWVLPSVAAALLACVPVAIRPVAAGSGIAEAKAVLNGIHVYQCTELATAACKAASVVLATVASLPCGLEGPLIFIGLAVGENWARVIPRAYPRLRSWRERRDFAAVGSATGVSAAFYAPVGGAIFAAEEGASHLSTRLMWRCFSAACVTVIVDYLFNSCLNGTFLYGRAIYNLSKFNGLPGQFTYRSTPSFVFLELFIFAGMGIVNGVVGAIFVELNKRINNLRRKYIRTRRRKFLEVLVVAAMSSTLMFLLPTLPNLSSCKSLNGVRANQQYFYRFDCPEGYYNDLATLLFTPTAGTSINLLFWENKDAFSGLSCLVAGSVHLLLLVLIFGMSIGMGIFVPLLYIGACFGRAFATVMPSANIRTYAIVGSVGAVAGVTRILVSLTVIMVQTTGLPYFVSPFMIISITAKVVGRWCFGGEGIYDEVMKAKSLPFLDEEAPKIASMSVLMAKDVMCPEPLVLLQPEMRVGDLIEALKSTNNSDFPVVDPTRNDALIGSIPAEMLIHLLCHKELFAHVESEPNTSYNSALARSGPIALGAEFYEDSHLMPTLDTVEREMAEDGSKDMIISIAQHIQLSPYTFNEEGSAERAYELFRTLGLRHLIVTGLDAKPIGIITRADLKFLEKIDKVERGCRSQETAVDDVDAPPGPIGPIV